MKVKEKKLALDDNMSLTPPVLWFCCECRAVGDFRQFTVQWQNPFCTVTPSPELSTFLSMSIKRTVWWQNLVAYLAAERTPLRHVLSDWFTTLSGREKGQAGGLRGAESKEEVNTATLCIYLLHYFSQASVCGGGCCFIWGPSIFLPDCKVCSHPRSPLPKGPRGQGQLQPGPAVTLIYFLFALLAGLLPLTIPPAAFSTAFVLWPPIYLIHKPLHDQCF